MDTIEETAKDISIRTQTDNAQHHFLLFEKILLSYFAILSILIIFFSKPFSNYYLYVLVNWLFSLMVLTVKTQSSTRTSIIWQFARFGLPIFLFTFMYEETGGLIHLIYHGWFDPLLIRIDQTIFGVNLGLWVEKFDHPILNEIFRIGYGSYNFIIINGAAILYFRVERRQYVQMLSAITLIFCLSYLMFILIQAQSPRFFHAHLFHTKMMEILFSWLQQEIMDIGSFRGGAFPSSHIAMAVIVWLSLYKKHLRSFWIMMPFVVLLVLGTVYARYHYAVDGMAGIIMAISIFAINSNHKLTTNRNGSFKKILNKIFYLN